jgi:hypothetical protein
VGAVVKRPPMPVLRLRWRRTLGVRHVGIERLVSRETVTRPNLKASLLLCLALTPLHAQPKRTFDRPIHRLGSVHMDSACLPEARADFESSPRVALQLPVCLRA